MSNNMYTCISDWNFYCIIECNIINLLIEDNLARYILHFSVELKFFKVGHFRFFVFFQNFQFKILKYNSSLKKKKNRKNYFNSLINLGKIRIFNCKFYWTCFQDFLSASNENVLLLFLRFMLKKYESIESSLGAVSF